MRRRQTLAMVLAASIAAFGVVSLRSSPGGAADGPAEKAHGGVKAFVIQMANGKAACRAATHAEVPTTIPSRDNLGVPVSQILPEELALAPQVKAANGLTIQLNALSQLQTDSNRTTVIAAFQRAAAIWTTRIKTPITITVNIDYGFDFPDGSPFGESTVGSTNSGSVAVDYPIARASLISTSANAAESAIYNSMPTTVVPVNAGIGTATEVALSLGQALGFVPLTPNGVVATISFNKEMPFDFNPDNGISFDRLDFVGVAAHEIGHALGFISNAGGGDLAPLTTWDLFRFRSGTTPGTFPTAQRIMSMGGTQMYYTTENFVLEGQNRVELSLSTGGPDGEGGDERQSSHWKDDDLTGRYIGIMDPTIGLGEFTPTTQNDFLALEKFGWNLVSSVSPPPSQPPQDNDGFGLPRTLVGCTGSVAGTNLNATRETGEPNHSPDSNAGTHSVWHTWQAPGSGSVTFNTAGSPYDTVLAVYTGASVDALTLIARNDDIPDVPGQPHQTTSAVTFTAIAGTTYQIAVDGYNNFGYGGDMGPFKLNWTQSSCNEPGRLIIAEDSSNLVAAIDSVTFRRGPFPVISNHNFSAIPRTRITFMIFGLGLTTADAGFVTVQAAGMTLPVEDVRPFTASGFSATHVTVRLPDGLTAGNWPLTVTVRGAASSNNPLLQISGP